MSQSLKKLTDQELADLIRQDSQEKLSINQSCYFESLKSKAKNSIRLVRECKRRNLDITTILRQS